MKEGYEVSFIDHVNANSPEEAIEIVAKVIKNELKLEFIKRWMTAKVNEPNREPLP